MNHYSLLNSHHDIFPFNFKEAELFACNQQVSGSPKQSLFSPVQLICRHQGQVMGRRPVQPAAQEGFPDKLESIGLVSKVGHSQTPTPGLLLKIQLPETLLSLFLPCNNSRQAGRKGWGAGRIKSCLLPPHQGFPEQLCLYGQDIR